MTITDYPEERHWRIGGWIVALCMAGTAVLALFGRVHEAPVLSRETSGCDPVEVGPGCYQIGADTVSFGFSLPDSFVVTRAMLALYPKDDTLRMVRLVGHGAGSTVWWWKDEDGRAWQMETVPGRPKAKWWKIHIQNARNGGIAWRKRAWSPPVPEEYNDH